MSEYPSIPFPPDQWSASGLLWAINKQILHPHALALSVAVPDPHWPASFGIISGYDSFSRSVNDVKAFEFARWLHTVKAGFEITGGTE